MRDTGSSPVPAPGRMPSVSRPVIALTSYLEPARWGAWDTRAVLLHDWYVDKLRGAGAHPVLLPPGDTDAEVLDRVDALVLTGGADVDPRRYGAEPGEHTDVPRVDRDGSELLLYRSARERGMPVLGICRGLQVMAVAEGGRCTSTCPTSSATPSTATHLGRSTTTARRSRRTRSSPGSSTPPP